MASNPMVSVVMPFYNDGPTIERAVNSILNQSETDLELIAVDDASTDDGYARISRIDDPRIRLLQNDRNRGSAATRNAGMRIARGEFIKPMDADDRCYPHYLAQCLRKMRENPSWGACGSWARMVGWGPRPYVFHYPCDPAAVRAYWLYGTPFVHSTILLRTSIIQEHKLEYDESRMADDYVFLLRLARLAPMGNLPCALVDYFCNPSGQSMTAGAAATLERLKDIRVELRNILGREVNDADLHYHAAIGNGTGVNDRDELRNAENWLGQFAAANQQSRVYDADGLARATAMVWFRLCRNSSHLGTIAFRAWFGSEHRRHYAPTLDEWYGFAGSWILDRIYPKRRRPQGKLVGI